MDTPAPDKFQEEFGLFVDVLEEGNLEQVKQLIGHNLALNSTRTSSVRTPLHVVMYGSDEDIQIQLLTLLLSKGADINAKDVRDWTVLHEAVFNSTVNVVKFVLEHGANVNAVDAQGMTPLDQAREDRFADTEEVLLAYGAETASRTHCTSAGASD